MNGKKRFFKNDVTIFHVCRPISHLFFIIFSPIFFICVVQQMTSPTSIGSCRSVNGIMVKTVIICDMSTIFNFTCISYGDFFLSNTGTYMVMFSGPVLAYFCSIFSEILICCSCDFALSEVWSQNFNPRSGSWSNFWLKIEIGKRFWKIWALRVLYTRLWIWHNRLHLFCTLSYISDPKSCSALNQPGSNHQVLVCCAVGFQGYVQTFKR